MSARVAINGFGRTGRSALRSAHQRGADIEVVAINDVMDTGTMAHLLRHDSVFGRFPAEVATGDAAMTVDGREISHLRGRSGPPALGRARDRCRDRVDRALRNHDEVGKHLTAGAERVIVSDPAGSLTSPWRWRELQPGLRRRAAPNHSRTLPARPTVSRRSPSAARGGGYPAWPDDERSCLHVDQRLTTPRTRICDGPGRRRSTFVPTSTGATTALGLVVPELTASCTATRCESIPTGSSSISRSTQRPTSVNEVNDVFAGHADRDKLKGILAYSEEPIVSSDIVGSPYSAIFDAGFTSVIDRTFVKVLAWYDNEWGYATRLSELAERVSAPLATV